METRIVFLQNAWALSEVGVYQMLESRASNLGPKNPLLLGLSGKEKLKGLMDLKILTWNIHKGIGGVDRRYDLMRVAEVIQEIKPDVALLQEVADGWPGAGGDLQGERLCELTGLCHLAFAPEHRFRKGGYGNAILSRFDIIDRYRVDLKIGWRKQRSALSASLRVITPGGPKRIVVASLHLGLAESERRQQLERLLYDPGLLSEGDPAVLGGDFNDVFGSLHKRFPQEFGRTTDRERSFPAAFPVFCLDGIYARGFLPLDGGLYRENRARLASDHLPLVTTLRLLEG